ncbi:MAG: hypothetical protein QOF49_119 [Chloroflexota bacterium]|jgi:hypothetical protein|nr:hypothetical protein [Chloroflexota bacterium]
MPLELLLPVFALTLLVNATLIGFAIRSLRRGGDEGADDRRWTAPATTTPAARFAPTVPARVEPTVEVAARTSRPAAETSVVETAGVDAIPVATTPVDPGPARSTEDGPKPRRARRVATTPTTAAAPTAADVASRPATRRGRRKFSLPQLGDDDEKVNRSIESFLAGADAPVIAAGAARDADRAQTDGTTAERTAESANAAAGAGDDGLDAAAGSRRPATTVVLVALAGGSAEAASNAAITLEQILRNAARGSDEVHVEAGGRFRVVLPATGELAARAYLRRIRAAIEPRLAASDRSLRLVVATATALNVPVRTATALARGRLDTAISGRPGDGATIEAGHDDAPAADRAANDRLRARPD